MPGKYPSTHLLKIITCTVVTTILAACSSDGVHTPVSSNGLIDRAQGCAYRLSAPYNMSADELNRFGCVYTDENGNEAVWEGTEGTINPDTTNINTGGQAISDVGTGSTTDGTSQRFAPELLDNGTGTVYSRAVNSALLSGTVLGSGEQLNSSLYKTIPVTTENMPADTTILHALVHESGLGDAYMIMHLHNTSNEVRCFIKHGEIEAYDASGQFISNGLFDSGFIDGSLGKTSSGEYTDTCASPNEVVYITELFRERLTLDQIASVKISDLNFRPDAVVADVAVQPISYEVVDDSVNVLISNQSSRTIELRSSKLIVLTDEGVPINTKLELHNDVMQPGAETIISYSRRIKGSSTNIRVLLNYDPLQ